ncbi:ATP-binding protein [Streptomyces sp. JV178]|jgi:anti-sigma regulatory factor (Ser/Thr protein kinase)|uniref:ATP-binding protein n=1 Tax=Streptomyces sp. JV178 TaxID=858632 RepID=UPI000C1B15F1|nr:ATP-binding protein [Streptomyces sp. JV178]PIM66730.1 ATP-binding protein [Streptomyces sp. JV178]
MPETGTDPWEYVLHIPHDPRAVTVSRRTLRLILTMHGLPALLDTAELLATELIANAVLHTKGPAALRVRWTGGALWIGAWDGDPQPPAPPVRSGEPYVEAGRGLALVRACTNTWGWQPSSRFGQSGKYVWCELLCDLAAA